ncbi:MAG: RnfABCDGE type electron transport complex subunit A [Nitrospiraceae bacterium]|nr:RnfABCDGE type electron transport complex subunit A [Nitrospiraceae bacterium]
MSGGTDDTLSFLILNTLLVNNFVLAQFLGICPFIGVSNKIETASRMGVAVIFVMLVSSALAYGINIVLVAADAEYLRLIAYIAVIASTVQLVEMFIKKTSPALFKALGIYLPLITTNCAVLGVAKLQTSEGYSFIQCIVFALGSGLGFTLALVIMAGIRQKLDLADVPGLAKGTAIILMIAGVLSMAFMGFAGLGS